MRVYVGVISVVITLAAIIFLLRMMRQAASEAVADTAFDVLAALGKASKLVTVTELTKLTHRNGGVIIAALRFLHRQDMVSSTHSMTQVESARLSARFAITQQGRIALKNGRKDL